MSVKISALPAASGANVTEGAVGFPYVDATTTTTRLTVAQLRTQITAVTLASTVDGIVLSRAGASVNAQRLSFANTTGRIDVGCEGTPAAVVNGATAYDAFVIASGGISVSADLGVTLHVRIASTGITTFYKGVTINSGVASAAGAGTDIVFGATTQATIGANGAASALTANPLGYLVFFKGATKCILPYYNG